MSKNLFPPNGGNPLSSPGLKVGASRGLLVKLVQILIPADDLNRLNDLLTQTEWAKSASDRNQIIQVMSVAFSESPD